MRQCSRVITFPLVGKLNDRRFCYFMAAMLVPFGVSIQNSMNLGETLFRTTLGEFVYLSTIFHILAS